MDEVVPPPSRLLIAAVLTSFAVVYVGLSVHAYRQKSATWDEPIHLTSGYLALARHDYRIDPSHPPFLRMLAALPLLAAGPIAVDTRAIDKAAPEDWAINGANYGFAHQFLYVDNDADRLLYSARFVVVLLGVLGGVLLFWWAFEWLGMTAAVCALVFYGLSPNLGAHASLVTTDFGLTCFSFGAIYFLWRSCRQLSIWNLIGLATFFSLAIVSKFSALLLWPIVMGLLALEVRRRRSVPASAALGIVALLAVCSFVAVWAACGFQYAPGPTASWLFRFQNTGAFQRDVPRLSAIAGFIDAHQLLPNVFTQGLLFFARSMVDVDPSYLAGDAHRGGWWYYFPLAFLIKTPVPLLVMVMAGVVVLVRRRRELQVANEAFVVWPIGLYLGSAMTSQLDIGLRHILPIYPFVLLIAAVAARQALRSSRIVTKLMLAGLAVMWVVRFGSVYPDQLAYFNWLVGGPTHGLEYLADSNLDWGQDLKRLRTWMSDRHIGEINLAYFGQADPKYYGIQCTYLPGSPDFAANAIARPKLPGYVAISATVLSGAYLDPAWRLYYRGFRGLTPTARIGYSIHVYWIDRWPDMGDPADPEALEAEHVLANGLLAQRWYSRAITHYRRYLARHPDRPAALNGLGQALMANGQNAEALATFERGVAVDPSGGRLRLNLANALIDGGRREEALIHVRRAVELRPNDADAYAVLGRALTAVGRWDDAVKAYEQALVIDPANLRARDGLSQLRFVRPGFDGYEMTPRRTA